MLWAKVLPSPHAHAEVVSIDTAPAAALAGVKGTWKDDTLIGKEVLYAGQIVAAVAAETEEIATEAVHLIKVEYKVLSHEVRDTDAALFQGNADKKEQGTPDDALGKADVVHSGFYGIRSSPIAASNRTARSRRSATVKCSCGLRPRRSRVTPTAV
jgi:CO/xanthine dehydrogenase Mo-binding subunit